MNISSNFFINKVYTNNKKYNVTLLKAVGIGFLVTTVFVVFASVTGAWFYKAQVSQNTINIGNISVVSSAINNPFTYTGSVQTSVPVSVTSLSNTHVTVRAYFNFMWEDLSPIEDVSIILSNENWTEGTDGYYYYNFVLNPSGQANDYANFLQTVEINNAPVEYINKTFLVNVYFEAAQYANSGYLNLWTTAPASWLSILS